jgi:hypothetical protein
MLGEREPSILNILTFVLLLSSIVFPNNYLSNSIDRHDLKLHLDCAFYYRFYRGYWSVDFR